MIPQYTKSKLRQDVLDNIKGNPDSSGTTVIDRILNRGVSRTLDDVDTRSTKRKFRLSVSHANDIIYDDSDGTYDLPTSVATAVQSNKYEFHCPTDLKGRKIIDIVKRTDRPTTAQYRLVGEEEFDRRKTVDRYLVSISDNSLERRLLVSGIDEITTETVNSVDSVTGNGTWSAVGGASAVANETESFVEGDGAVSFTSDLGSATAGIKNSTMTAVDIEAISDNDGSVYVWVYIPEASNITSFTLDIGSSSTAYRSMTVTHTTDLVAFYAGWNLLRFDFGDATDTGTPDMGAVDYVSFYVNKDTAKAVATGWIVDAVIAANDSGNDVLYYSKYPWMSTDGVFKLESDDDDDFLVCDSDEYNMFVEKCSELACVRLGNDKDKQMHKAEYAESVTRYFMRYASESQPETDQYHYLGSLG